MTDVCKKTVEKIREGAMPRVSKDETPRLLNLPLLHARKLRELDGQDAEIARYLLEAIPVLNSYHLTNRAIQENEGSCYSVVMQHEILERGFLVKYFPSLRKKTCRPKHDPQRRLSTLSACCGARKQQTQELAMVCTECGAVLEAHTVSLHDPLRNISYGREIVPTKTFSYKRLNHLREFLRALCGEAAAPVPTEVFDRVARYFRRTTMPRELINGARVRDILKRFGFNSYYESSVAIAKRLNGTYKPFSITPLYEEKLISQFVKLEKPFERVREKYFPTRRNFLSYPHCVLHLNRLNGREDLNVHIRTLKSTHLAHKQERLWKRVIKELNWEYTGPLTIR